MNYDEKIKELDVQIKAINREFAKLKHQYDTKIEFKLVSKIPPQAIIKLIANYFGFSPNEIKKRTRKKQPKDARFVCFYFLNKIFRVSESKVTLTDLAKELTLKGDNLYNHATVLHSIGEVENLIETNKFFREDIEKLKLLIQKIEP